MLGRAIERMGGGADGDDAAQRVQVGRVTYDILRAVPIAPLTVSTQVLRPGRRVELLEARLSDASGEVMRATAWRLRPDAVDLPPGLVSRTPPPGPEAGEEGEFFPTGQSVGYHTAMEYRFVTGAFLEPGPATVWMRMRRPLVAGETPSALQRVLVAADSGNGVSAALDWRRFLFINVDLTVQLNRLPAGEWVCLDAITIPEPTGVGIADTALFDERGPIGRATQTLLVTPRSPG